MAYGSQQACLPLILTATNGPILMGRNWLLILKLDWKQIKQVCREPVDEVKRIFTKYKSLFDGGLGTTAHLKLKENVTPQFV